MPECDHMNNIENILNNNTVNIAATIKKRMKFTQDEIRQNGCYVFGNGRLGKHSKSQLLKNNIPFKGFISNQADSKDVQAPSVLSGSDIVIIASFYVCDISRQLDQLRVDKYIYYEELAQAFPEFDTYYIGFQGIYEELIENKNEYIGLYDRLYDKASKDILFNLVNYRLSLDFKYTQKAYDLSCSHGSQDLDELVLSGLPESVSFFDVGGFDGSSTESFIKAVPDYDKVYFFEPDIDILNNSRKRLSKYRDIEYYQAGIGKMHETLRYDALGAGGGTISDSGNRSIEIICIDDFIGVNNAYIKMDIEGAESDAIEGAKMMISKNHPFLSISLYHKPGDFHKLVNQVLSYYPDYKLVIRHYSETYDDTRCYFIP